MKTYNLLDFIAVEHLTKPVVAAIKAIGNRLETDDDGFDPQMRGGAAGTYLMIKNENEEFGAAQYGFILDGHLILAVWFGGEELVQYSFTFKPVPFITPAMNPMNQYVDSDVIAEIEQIGDFWIATKQA